MCSFSFHFHSSKGWASPRRVRAELGFELISFVQSAPVSQVHLQPVGKQFCFLLCFILVWFGLAWFHLVLFERGGERRRENDKHLVIWTPKCHWEDHVVLGKVLFNRSNNALEVAGETVPGNRTDLPVPLTELRPHLQEGIVLGKLLCGCWLDLSCLM